MYCVKNVTEDYYWVGADDHRQPLFENIHPVDKGVSYNSYLLLDEKTVLFDTVDWSVCRQFLENIEAVLKGRELDYLVVNHMEPDHGAAIEEVILRYPNIKIISSQKAFQFMKQFGFQVEGKEEVVKDGEERSFGKHTVRFLAAPMVHWPEAMVSFDVTEGILFSADAFGMFGALNGKLFYDEFMCPKAYMDEFRRYYTNIVGKFGMQVTNLLKKVSALDVRMICPLHGGVIRSQIGLFLEKYKAWSSYEPEEKGVLIVYASMYGNTESAVKVLASRLQEKGITKIESYDVSGTHISYLIAESFHYSHIILASPTYNNDMYPLMHNYLVDMKALNLQNRTIGIVENGTWGCMAGKQMRAFLETMKNMVVLDEQVTLLSAMNEESDKQIHTLVERLQSEVLS